MICFCDEKHAQLPSQTAESATQSYPMVFHLTDAKARLLNELITPNPVITFQSKMQHASVLCVFYCSAASKFGVLLL